ncbi:3-phosphoshikimate 1-carboxyvinyltransferase [Dehalobacter sp. DCM]|uniref:3-phosphoshikimate 1-carboxyvinyltransferase n=1 Tax=Dehalobacter sp. DCM TaxID=2907827 RepID=UPI003081C508|nr:3-phosphoshikimate 1-carboxyvinyltransferase [Dehalobacter sp. DCM]
MACLRILPSNLSGDIRIPPSKSISHRAVISAALADGVSRIHNVILSEDIIATLDGMTSLGTSILASTAEAEEPGLLELKGCSQPQLIRDTIRCRESGSTLRFLIPIATLTGGPVTFTGEGKLSERPLNAYYDLFDQQGILYETAGRALPLTITGRFKPGKFSIAGNVSSQFISGLMFMLPLLQGDSNIVITTDLESRGYIDLTIDALRQSGVIVENSDYHAFFIGGKQKYNPIDFRVEGDFSQTAFWLVAGTIGTGLTCYDLNRQSLQGDRVILDILWQMGAKMAFSETGDRLDVLPAATHGIEIDVSQCPDLVPILAVIGALSQGTTRIINAGRLRIKESDRLKAIATELNTLGARIREQEEGLLIEGVETLHGGTVDSWNDHRIAMALAVASIKSSGPVILNGSEAVRKSYPHFWRDFTRLGGIADEWNLG